MIGSWCLRFDSLCKAILALQIQGGQILCHSQPNITIPRLSPGCLGICINSFRPPKASLEITFSRNLPLTGRICWNSYWPAVSALLYNQDSNIEGTMQTALCHTPTPLRLPTEWEVASDHTRCRKESSLLFHQIQFTEKKKRIICEIYWEVLSTLYIIRLMGNILQVKQQRPSSKATCLMYRQGANCYPVPLIPSSVFCSLHCILLALKPRLLGNKSFLWINAFPLLICSFLN